jgi:hypothetical protein
MSFRFTFGGFGFSFRTGGGPASRTCRASDMTLGGSMVKSMYPNASGDETGMDRGNGSEGRGK